MVSAAFPLKTGAGVCLHRRRGTSLGAKLTCVPGQNDSSVLPFEPEKNSWLMASESIHAAEEKKNRCFRIFDDDFFWFYIALDTLQKVYF